MDKQLQPEREHDGPIWRHPYALYVILTMAIFAVMLVIAWVAWSSGWIVQR